MSASISMRLYEVTVSAGVVLMLCACESPAHVSPPSDGVPWRPAAFDDCRLDSRVRFADLNERYLVLVSGEQRARLCVIELGTYIDGHVIVLPPDVVPAAVGIDGGLVWVYNAALREVVFVKIANGGVTDRWSVPTYEPSLFPNVLSARANGEGVVVHLPTDARMGRQESFVSRVSASGGQQVLDSLSVTSPLIVRRMHDGSATIRLPVPWARRDLVARLPGGIAVYLRQADLADRQRLDVTQFLTTGERRTLRLDAQWAVTERPGSIDEWIAGVLSDSVVRFFPSRPAAVAQLKELANAAKPYPLYGRLVAIDRARILLQRAWPHAEEWEFRDGKMQLTGHIRIPVAVTVFGATRSGIWGLASDTSGRPLLVRYQIPGGSE